MEDLKNNIDVKTSLVPDTRTASANGSGVDLQGFEGACVAFIVGTITDGTHTPSVEESDNDTDYSAVAAGNLDGALAALASDTNQRAGYRGGKKYVRAVVTVAGATSGGKYSAVVVRGEADIRPVS